MHKQLENLIIIILEKSTAVYLHTYINSSTSCAIGPLKVGFSQSQKTISNNASPIETLIALKHPTRPDGKEVD